MGFSSLAVSSQALYPLFQMESLLPCHLVSCYHVLFFSILLAYSETIPKAEIFQVRFSVEKIFLSSYEVKQWRWLSGSTFGY